MLSKLILLYVWLSAKGASKLLRREGGEKQNFIPNILGLDT